MTLQPIRCKMVSLLLFLELQVRSTPGIQWCHLMPINGKRLTTTDYQGCSPWVWHQYKSNLQATHLWHRLSILAINGQLATHQLATTCWSTKKCRLAKTPKTPVDSGIAAVWRQFAQFIYWSLTIHFIFYVVLQKKKPTGFFALLFSFMIFSHVGTFNSHNYLFSQLLRCLQISNFEAISSARPARVDRKDIRVWHLPDRRVVLFFHSCTCPVF